MSIEASVHQGANVVPLLEELRLVSHRRKVNAGAQLGCDDLNVKLSVVVTGLSNQLCRHLDDLLNRLYAMSFFFFPEDPWCDDQDRWSCGFGSVRLLTHLDVDDGIWGFEFASLENTVDLFVNLSLNVAAKDGRNVSGHG